jgi:ArsR family transcriptional regulator
MEQFFKTLADETRLRCLFLIFDHHELCVCELIHALVIPQSKISRHLAIMRLNDLIQQRRVGQWVLYSLSPRLPTLQQTIIAMTLAELKHQPPFNDDHLRLAKMTDRPNIHRQSN